MPKHRLVVQNQGGRYEGDSSGRIIVGTPVRKNYRSRGVRNVKF